MGPRRIKIAPHEAGHDHDVGAEDRRPTGDGHTASRWLRHPLAILAAVLVGGYAAAAVLLNVLVDTQQVRVWLEPRASEALNRPVSTGDARVSLLPRPSIHVSDVRIDNLENFDGPALTFIERVRFDVRWLPLLIGRVSVHRVHLDAPRVYLAIDEAGTSNFGDLVPSTAEAGEPPQPPVGLGVERVEVSKASLSYFNAPGARSFTVSGADVRVGLAPDGAAGWRADVVVESDSLLARMATVTDEILHLEGPRLSLTARSDGAGRSIDVVDGLLELSGESLALRGRLAGLAGSRPSYDLQLTNDSLDAGVLAAAFPPRARSKWIPAADGRVGVTFQLTGHAAGGSGPVVRGSLHLENVAVRLGGRRMVDRLSGTVGVSPDTVVLDSLTGVFADGPFELSGTATRDSQAVALRTRARPDLDALDRLGLVPAGVTVSGDAALELALAGRLDALDSMEVVGSVTLDGFQAKHARVGVPLYVPAGELTLAGGEVSWTELPVLIGQDEVVTSGRASGLVHVANENDRSVPVLRAIIRGPRLDLGAIFPAGEGTPAVTYGRAAFAHLGGSRIDGRPASAVPSELEPTRPRSLPWQGSVELQLDTLDFRSYHLEAVTGHVEVSDSSMTVDAPSFRIWGGTAAGSLRLGVGDRAGEPFALTFAVDSANAEGLLSTTTPLGSAVSGTLTLELEVTGSLDSSLLPVAHELSGHATLSIIEGRIHDTGPNLVIADFLGSQEWGDVSFTTWHTDLDLAARRLEIRASELISEQGRVAFDGLVHLDGSHDLSMGLSIPPDRLGTVSLRRTGIGQSVLDHLSAAGSSLDLGLRMSGVLATPQVEPDASNAVALDR